MKSVTVSFLRETSVISMSLFFKAVGSWTNRCMPNTSQFVTKSYEGQVPKRSSVETIGVV